jgi:N-acetylneuraminate synthase
MNEMKIRNKMISEKNPAFFIAEIGINHNGSLEIAKQLIDLAKICDVDAVKFQKRTPEICVPNKVRNRIKETPWGEMTYFEYKNRIEFGEKEFKDIDRYCKEKNIIWFATPWDLPSVDFLEKFDVPCYKIASAHLTNKKLLEKIKELNKPVFLSTGMSTEKQIEKADEVLNETDHAILHCNSSYPAVDNELNLNYITILKQKFPESIIGYSGHEEGISASLIAANLGAKIIERHITLDRAMWGTDQAASLEFSGLRRLVRDIKKLPTWLGDGEKRVYDSEKLVRDKLRSIDDL